MLQAQLIRFLRDGLENLMKYSTGCIPYQRESNAYILLRQNAAEDRMQKHELSVPSEELCLRYADSVGHFLESGERLVNSMKVILRKGGFSLEKANCILDFGCGVGRMTRWFKGISSVSKIWGVDVQSESILWCKSHLSPPFQFATITTAPHLPFEDRYFDLIYAGSVFTHIDDLADAWFLELRRVLKPGGMLYATIHDKKSIELLKDRLKDVRLAKSLSRHAEWAQFRNLDFEMFTIRRSIHSQVFYDTDSLCRRLEGFSYRVVSINQEAYEYQTALLLRKAEGG